MKHISINVSDEIKNILPNTLEKDLQDNEAICPVCHGLGIKVVNNSYGIKGDTSEVAKKSNFPYNHQSITFCHNCFNGVIRLCEYCGKPIQKGYVNKCDCEQYQARQDEIEETKYQETINKATETNIENVSTYLYDHGSDRYFADVDDFVSWYQNEYINDEEMFDHLPKVLWVCTETQISINAGCVVEDACEELHEDALDNISSDDIRELQSVIDKWCKKQTGTLTYYPEYKEYVKVSNGWFTE